MLRSEPLQLVADYQHGVRTGQRVAFLQKSIGCCGIILTQKIGCSNEDNTSNYTHLYYADHTYLVHSKLPPCLQLPLQTCLVPYRAHLRVIRLDTPTRQKRMNSSEERSNGITGRLSSLWNTSTDKDDTCVTWGLVSS